MAKLQQILNQLNEYNINNKQKLFPRYTSENIDNIPKIDQASLLTFYINTSNNNYDSVRLPLQENIGTLGVSSSWDNIARSGILELLHSAAGVVGGVAKDIGAGDGLLKLGRLAEKGLMFSLKAHNAQAFLSTYAQLYWNGSNFDPISFDFVLEAIEDAKEDVIIPLKKLMSWGAPVTSKTAFNTRDDGMIKNATKKIGNAFGEGVRKVQSFLADEPNSYFLKSPPFVSVVVGNFLTLHRVAITNISVTFNNTLDDFGYPTSAKGRITIKPTLPVSSVLVHSLFRGA